MPTTKTRTHAVVETAIGWDELREMVKTAAEADGHPVGEDTVLQFLPEVDRGGKITSISARLKTETQTETTSDQPAEPAGDAEPVVTGG